MGSGSHSTPGKLRAFLELVKFEHTVFALPFAYLGMLLAAGGLPTFHQFAWITVAMAAARTLAFAVNRLADRYYDARNPRTANRPLVTGKIAPREVVFYAMVSVAILVFAAWQLGPLPLRLSPVAILFLIGYSYTKRFTVLAHWVLGVTDAMAPVGAWVAVRGSLFTVEDVPAWLLMAAVTFWIAGFDLIYACQDADFDRREGLHAWPARYGIASALNVAMFCHVITVVMLAILGIVYGLGAVYYLGVLATAGLLWYEHSLVSPDDLSKVNMAFFNVNAVIAAVLFAATLAEMFL